VPQQIQDYLMLTKEFCKWYVEVTWQRLPEKYKTRELELHWSRFGDLENPKYKKVLTPDYYDDWKGTGQIPLRPRELAQSLYLLFQGRFGGINPEFSPWKLFWSRLVSVNKKW
jgi:hypothetical protein